MGSEYNEIAKYAINVSVKSRLRMVQQRKKGWDHMTIQGPKWNLGGEYPTLLIYTISLR